MSKTAAHLLGITFVVIAVVLGLAMRHDSTSHATAPGPSHSVVQAHRP